MIPWLKSILFDEAAAQRYLSMGLALLGAWITTGGVVPGTEAAPIRIPPSFVPFGPLLTGLAFFINGGKTLPGNGKPAAPPEAPKV